MKKFFLGALLAFTLSLAVRAVGQEIISDFTPESLPVLNEELRVINKAILDLQHPKTVPVAELPAASAENLGSVRGINDGASVNDCTVGGGSTYHLCISNGTAWVQA